MDPDSMLAFYKQLIALRRAKPALVSGGVTEVDATEGVLRFVRSDGNERFEVLLNLAEQKRRLPTSKGNIVACTTTKRLGESVTDGLELDASEAVVIHTAR